MSPSKPGGAGKLWAASASAHPTVTHLFSETQTGSPGTCVQHFLWWEGRVLRSPGPSCVDTPNIYFALKKLRSGWGRPTHKRTVRRLREWGVEVRTEVSVLASCP